MPRDPYNCGSKDIQVASPLSAAHGRERHSEDGARQVAGEEAGDVGELKAKARHERQGTRGMA
jgi:hypothetical protein